MVSLCRPMDEQSFALMKEHFSEEIAKRKGYVICDGYVLPGIFAEQAERISNFDVYDDDVWVCSFPKSGTTWTQEMVWCIANSCEAALQEKLGARFPFFDFNFIINREELKRKNPRAYEEMMSTTSLESLSNRPRPRYIKTHLPFDLLPKKLRSNETAAKIIYVMRNPRDACISLYHQRKGHGGFDGTLKQFVELFIKDSVNYGPYWKHTLSYWNRRHDANTLIIRFEDMKKDLSDVIRRVAGFLDKSLEPHQITALCQHLSFNTMKNNPNVNTLTIGNVEMNGKSNESSSLLRSGQVNQWKETIDDELKEKLQKWEVVNLKNTDFPLNYDI